MTVRLSPDAFAILPGLVERAVVDAAYASATAPASDGWTEVTIPIESVDQAVRELLGFGADAEVLAPAEVREGLTDTLAALTRIYDPPDVAAAAGAAMRTPGRPASGPAFRAWNSASRCALANAAYP